MIRLYLQAGLIGVSIGLATVPSNAAPHVQDVVIGNECLAYAGHPFCRPGDRWWLILRTPSGIEHSTEVPARAIYDACRPTWREPGDEPTTYYPACATRTETLR